MLPVWAAKTYIKDIQMNNKQTTMLVPPPPQIFLAKFLKTTALAFSLILTLTLATVSCSDSGDGGSTTQEEPPGSNNTDGNFTDPVDNTAAPSVTDFSYRMENSVIEPLSNSINAPTSVKINGSAVTIKLGTPKTFINFVPDLGVTTSPADVRVHYLYVFYSSNGEYVLRCTDDLTLFLVYFEKDVTFNGTRSEGGNTHIYDSSARKGWNYYYKTKVDDNTYTYTYTTTFPSGYKWKVVVAE
jgi:hypothetical protein